MDKTAAVGPTINNGFYDDLGARWYEASDDPVALLRAESNLRGPWVAAEIERRLRGAKAEVLDIGCGGGFLTNFLASKGHKVTGIDLSENSLEVAKRYDKTQSVMYQKADAYELPYAGETFDVVACMDFLEHVDDTQRVISEATRVLRPGGIFFFHTFAKNPLAWLIVIKGVEWFVKNTPPHMHVYHLLINSSEVTRQCKNVGLEVQDLRGCRPVIAQWPFWKLLLTREVDPKFRFRFTKSTLISYSGFAVKSS